MYHPLRQGIDAADHAISARDFDQWMDLGASDVCGTDLLEEGGHA